MLPGAGGGGFIFLVARDPDAARQIRRRLTESPPNRLARFFDFDVDQTGVKVTVL
jgi:galactokinase/mevalonate kinase-like predicted kinase